MSVDMLGGQKKKLKFFSQLEKEKLYFCILVVFVPSATADHTCNKLDQSKGITATKDRM